MNNAGIGLTGPIMGATARDWDWLIDVNIRGVGQRHPLLRAAHPAHGEGGHVVTTASMARPDAVVAPGSTA